MIGLTCKVFEFGAGGPITVACRESPEELGRLTLTLQNGDQRADQQPQHGAQGDASAAADLIGLDLWPAAVAVCQYLAAHPQLVAGIDALELGAGMGLPGILAARLGAQNVLLTDYEPLVLEQLAANLASNGVASSCSTQLLDLRRLDRLPQAQLGCWRLIMAADVLYASVIVRPLAEALQALLHSEGVALVGHQIRRAITLDKQTRLPRLEDTDEPYESFLLTCHAAGLSVRILSQRQTCSNVDSDPMMLVAVGKEEGPLQQLPGWDHGSTGGEGGGGGGGREGA